MLKIYGRANSINVRKVLWLANEIGLTYAREDWGRGFRATNEPEFERVSIFGVVPVIDDDGFILRESNTICRYLATKHKRSDLYPAELRVRAFIEMWMDWANTDYGTGMRAVFQGKVNGMAPWKDSALIAWGAAEWNKQSERLARHLAANGPYVCGAEFTLGDIPVGLMVNRWMSIHFDKPKLPALDAYYQRLLGRPGFVEHGRNAGP
jgi:glutathione S-transferase